MTLAEASAIRWTPRRLAWRLWRQIHYTLEDEWIWKPPERTWGDGWGDCEDFAILSRHLLRHYHTRFVVLDRPGRRMPHAVAAIETSPNDWGLMDVHTWRRRSWFRRWRHGPATDPHEAVLDHYPCAFPIDIWSDNRLHTLLHPS